MSEREKEWRKKHIMIDVSGHWKPLFEPGRKFSPEETAIVVRGVETARGRTEGLVTAWLWRAHATRGEDLDLRVLVESAYLQGYVDAITPKEGPPNGEH